MEEGSEPTSALHHKRKHRVHCWELRERKLLSKSAEAGREMLRASGTVSWMSLPSVTPTKEKEEIVLNISG